MSTQHKDTRCRWAEREARPLAARFAAPRSLQLTPGWVLGAGQKATLGRRFRRILWRQVRRPFSLAWLDGLQIYLYPGNEVSRSIFVTGLFDPNELSLLARILKPGMTFVDVGANMGMYTLFAAQRVGERGRVLAIEPSRREVEILRRNVELNGLGNVTIAAVAVSDREAEVELRVAPAEKSGHNTLGAAFGHGTALDHREMVRAVRLDELIREQKLPPVDVVKMDIEGGEEAALRGAEKTLREQHPVVLLELSQRMLQHQQSTEAGVLRVLADRGYRVHGFDPNTGLPTEEPRPCSEENVVAVYGEDRPW